MFGSKKVVAPTSVTEVIATFTSSMEQVESHQETLRVEAVNRQAAAEAIVTAERQNVVAAQSEINAAKEGIKKITDFFKPSNPSEA